VLRYDSQIHGHSVDLRDQTRSELIMTADADKTDSTEAAREWAALDLLIHGFRISRMIRLVADLGIADRIAPGTRVHVDELAAACGVLAGPLLRVLRALAAFRIFSVTHDGWVAQTLRSGALRRDAPNSHYYSARYQTTTSSWRAWGALDEALTGGTPFRAAWNTTRFDYLRNEPAEARIFDEFMANSPDDRHRAMAAAYDFSDARLIADIGGGNGEALRMILARFPKVRGVLFDRQDVVDAVGPERRANGRIMVEAGSFFEGVPAKADFYLLNWILHDWSDEDCRRILRACRAAMGPGARLLIGERILEQDPTVGHPTGYLFDIQMMVMFVDARERTEAEFRDLLAASGFSLRRVISTASPFSVLEAHPA
jgi:hypothetical protein